MASARVRRMEGGDGVGARLRGAPQVEEGLRAVAADGGRGRLRLARAVERLEGLAMAPLHAERGAEELEPVGVAGARGEQFAQDGFGLGDPPRPEERDRPVDRGTLAGRRARRAHRRKKRYAGLRDSSA
jgi:hypothetical protein